MQNPEEPPNNFAANDNKTKLYRIRRKSDGKFLIGKPRDYPKLPTATDSMWGKDGAFWKQQETIRKHLLSLCAWRLYNGYGQDIVDRWDGRKFEYWPSATPIKIVRYFYDRLDKYEVIVIDISVHGENKIEARGFANLPNDLIRVSA